MDYCLHNLPEKIYGGSICGDGFTEDGEECDCGLPQVSMSYSHSPINTAFFTLKITTFVFFLSLEK